MIDVSKFNNNYIARFLARIEKAIEDETYVYPSEVKKAQAFYDHRIGINERNAERLINKVKKENEDADKELEALGISTEVTDEELATATA
jgi:hypothetical protein